LCHGKKAAGSIGRRIPWCFARAKFDSFFRMRVRVREDTYVSDVFYAKFPGNDNNFYYLGIPRIESREKKNEDRTARRRLGPEDIRGKDSGRERERRGRGLDSSCTVNNTPPGRDRLAHPRHPATIYLLFVPHTFVSWLLLPSKVPRVFTAAETKRERRNTPRTSSNSRQTFAGGSVLTELNQKEIQLTRIN